MGLDIGFAGLGAMGYGMASHLVKQAHRVTGYDVYEPSLAKFKAAGGDIASSPKDAAAGKNYFICMVANAQQADSVLFDSKNGAIQVLPPNAALIMCSTVPAAYLREIQEKLEERSRSDIFVLDCPVSGGTVRAANGSLTILSSGSPAALDRGNGILTELSEKLFVIPGGIGSASNVKMVNQLLAGVHIAAAAEAMGLAAKMGLNTREVYESIIKGPGNSWMFENRVPHMLENDWHPHSALDIFVKDMGIVTSSARSHGFPVPLSAAAEQLYISASSQGYGRQDDSGIVRIYMPQAPSGVHEHAREPRSPEDVSTSFEIIGHLLESIHIAAAAEAMAFAAKIGLDTQSLYEIIRQAAGGSWMFEHQVPAMLKADWTPQSNLKTRVENLELCLDGAKRLLYPATLTTAAHQLFIMAASHGWGHESEAGVVRVWELITSVSVSKSARSSHSLPFKPRDYDKLSLTKAISGMPQEYSGNMLDVIHERMSSGKAPLLVILDDDPTGTQTCHNVSVLTVWDHDTLCTELSSAKKGFFILTNSRALPPEEAKTLISEICQNVAKAARETGKEFEVVLRGDSTLRGHFPLEPETVEEVLGKVDAWILAPFFYQGGRYTIDDVHYVAEGDVLVPASQTPFAEDATFGYKSSNLRDYVLEKAGSRFTKDNLWSITLKDIRLGGPKKVTEQLLSAPKGGVIIVNAAAESDMFVFAAGLLAAEQHRKYLYRTGAAFVSSRLGITSIPPLSAQDLHMNYDEGSTGGLIIAGSYVPKTTAQLKVLRERRKLKLHTIELDVAKMIHSTEEMDASVERAVIEATEEVKKGEDVLIMTSRKLLVGQDALSSLQIGSIIAAALVKVVQNINIRPRYIIAKGGITSSDVATKGLNMKRAMIIGQAAPGVPLWRCDEPTTRHAGVPYVVFPGNVGGEDALADLVERWALPDKVL